MRHAILPLSLCLLAALPLSALADEKHCAHSAPRDAALDLAGVKTVVFEAGPHDITITGQRGAAGALRGRACASDARRLAELVVSQRRDGDRLIVRAERTGLLRKGSWSGKDYGYLSLTATVPDDLAVRVDVGSGDVRVQGVATLSGDVGSGDLSVREVRGTFYADVGSGDIDATDIGALHVVSVGSGDLEARGIRGDARIGEVNSGDLDLQNVKGKVTIASLGSGDISLTGIGGDVRVQSIGSGDLEAVGVGGALVVERVGSGAVSHRGVVGTVRVPKD